MEANWYFFFLTITLSYATNICQGSPLAIEIQMSRHPDFRRGLFLLRVESQHRRSEFSTNPTKPFYFSLRSKNFYKNNWTFWKNHRTRVYSIISNLSVGLV